jgi:hypothetical protein
MPQPRPKQIFFQSNDIVCGNKLSYRSPLPPKDLLPVIAMGDHMVEQSFGVNAGMARHTAQETELVNLGKLKRLVSPSSSSLSSYPRPTPSILRQFEKPAQRRLHLNLMTPNRLGFFLFAVVKYTPAF